MIVIVETNFILELILQQERASHCEELLSLCSSSRPARLAIPSFAVAEAGMTLERHRGERQEFLNKDLSRQRREIGSGKLLQRFEEILTELQEELLSAQIRSDSDWKRFRIVTLEKMDVFPLTSEAIEESVAIQLGREIEYWPDALIFASVKTYLKGLRAAGTITPAIFVSTDGAAFGHAVITKQLRNLGCSYVNSFANAVERIRSTC